MKLKKLFILSTLIFVLGIIFISYSFYQNSQTCENKLKRTLKNKYIIEPFKGRRAAIYIIRNMNSGCKNILWYDGIKKLNENIYVVIYVWKDFSDIDIENFIYAFGVPANHKIEIINRDWENIYNKCSAGESDYYNLSILLNSDNTICKIRRF